MVVFMEVFGRTPSPTSRRRPFEPQFIPAKKLPLSD
jgi:hypothetical protein